MLVAALSLALFGAHAPVYRYEGEGRIESPSAHDLAWRTAGPGDLVAVIHDCYFVVDARTVCYLNGTKVARDQLPRDQKLRRLRAHSYQRVYWNAGACPAAYLFVDGDPP